MPNWILVLASMVFAENPVVQTKFTADPAPMVWNDTVFLYTSHDEDNATGNGGFQMKEWLLYTSSDMANWRDHGVVASLASFKWGPQTNGAWAPQVIRRNGKFYMYAPLHGKGIGVLVADTPYGPFKDPLGKALVATDPWTFIDPSPYIDADGQAYLYFGNPDAYYVKLNADMISFTGAVTKVPKINTYQEGPWIYKRGSSYYLAFASTCCPEGIGYAMAPTPTGPWTYKGSIMDGNAKSSGNHPGIVDFKGKSYVFGFNYAINFSLTTEHKERRSVCLAELKYNADGTIPKLPWWGGGMPSGPGVDPVDTLDPYQRVEAETMAWSQGVKTEVAGEGGMDLTAIQNGSYIKLRAVDFGQGAASLDVRVASATSGGNIEIRLDKLDGTLAGTCAVAGTGGWQTWTTKSCQVSQAKGVHDLFLKFTGGAGQLFNVDWWRFKKVSGLADRPAVADGTLRLERVDRGWLARSGDPDSRWELVAVGGRRHPLGEGSEMRIADDRFGSGIHVLQVRHGTTVESRRILLAP